MPPFETKYLRRGHAVHFRCRHPEAFGMRIDVMTRMRGVESFPTLWARRNSIELPDGTRCDVLSLPDLVQAKKTQRDKDWPMVRRLIEADYFQHREGARPAQVRFWLRELRTPELLIEAAERWPTACAALKRRRPLLMMARASPARPPDDRSPAICHESHPLHGLKVLHHRKYRRPPCPVVASLHRGALRDSYASLSFRHFAI